MVLLPMFRDVQPRWAGVQEPPCKGESYSENH